MKTSFIIGGLLFISFFLFGQKHTVSGHVRDDSSGETLIGASIYQPNLSNGTTSNSYGFYSITLPYDSITLVVSHVGLQPKKLKFLLKKDTLIDVSLLKSDVLNEITVRASPIDGITEVTQMSSVSFSNEQIKKVPAILGETDVLKVLQLMPGVQSGNEGTTGLYVRGGGADQNLILLDGVPVYNVSHLFGFFSAFNSDAINHVELIKGGFPARYGGRLSSVVNITTRNGNMNRPVGEASIGLLSTRFTLEVPLVKEKTSMIISGRRS